MRGCVVKGDIQTQRFTGDEVLQVKILKSRQSADTRKCPHTHGNVSASGGDASLQKYTIHPFNTHKKVKMRRRR